MVGLKEINTMGYKKPVERTRDIEGNYKERLRHRLSDKQFKTELNELRDRYAGWVSGPPMTQTYFRGTCEEDMWTETFEIGRDAVESPASVDQRDDPFIAEWESFESRWKVTIPKEALTSTLPDLTTDSLQHWLDYGLRQSMLRPPVSELTADLGYTPPDNKIAFEVAKDYPIGLTLHAIEQALRREKAVLPPDVSKRRIHCKKREEQLAEFSAWKNNGERPKDIAEAKSIPESTVKSRRAVARTILGLPKPKESQPLKRGREVHNYKLEPGETISHEVAKILSEKERRLPWFIVQIKENIEDIQNEPIHRLKRAEESDDMRRETRHALDCLSRDCRAAVEAIDMYGEDIQDHAKEQGKSVEQVQVLLKIGRTKLQKLLQDYAPIDRPLTHTLRSAA
jgi:DNA-directed RNA polymerase specialized sigma24 family protein